MKYLTIIIIALLTLSFVGCIPIEMLRVRNNLVGGLAAIATAFSHLRKEAKKPIEAPSVAKSFKKATDDFVKGIDQRKEAVSEYKTRFKEATDEMWRKELKVSAEAGLKILNERNQLWRDLSTQREQYIKDSPEREAREANLKETKAAADEQAKLLKELKDKELAIEDAYLQKKFELGEDQRNYVEIHNVTKDIAFNKTMEWIALNYNSAKSVIQLSDKLNSKIIIKAKLALNIQIDGLGTIFEKGYLDYTLNISLKDNKAKFTFYTGKLTFLTSSSVFRSGNYPPKNSMLEIINHYEYTKNSIISTINQSNSDW